MTDLTRRRWTYRAAVAGCILVVLAAFFGLYQSVHHLAVQGQRYGADVSTLRAQVVQLGGVPKAGPSGVPGAIPGPQGPAGRDGRDGLNGRDGQSGPVGPRGLGTPGAAGHNGGPGGPGVSGATGTPGAPGVQGPAGPAGQDGATGAKGDPGTLPGTFVIRYGGGSYTCTLTDPTTYDCAPTPPTTVAPPVSLVLPH